jgi:hypothetical protein
MTEEGNKYWILWDSARVLGMRKSLSLFIVALTIMLEAFFFSQQPGPTVTEERISNLHLKIEKRTNRNSPITTI